MALAVQEAEALAVEKPAKRGRGRPRGKKPKADPALYRCRYGCERDPMKGGINLRKHMMRVHGVFSCMTDTVMIHDCGRRYSPSWKDLCCNKLTCKDLKVGSEDWERHHVSSCCQLPTITIFTNRISRSLGRPPSKRRPTRSPTTGQLRRISWSSCHITRARRRSAALPVSPHSPTRLLKLLPPPPKSTTGHQPLDRRKPAPSPSTTRMTRTRSGRRTMLRQPRGAGCEGFLVVLSGSEFLDFHALYPLILREGFIH